MTFKANWEKASIQYHVPEDIIKKMILITYPTSKLKSYQMLTGGCANLNFKIALEDEPSLFILRVYFRDKEAASREQKLGNLLNQTIPAPQIYHIGEIEGYCFTITKFMPGIPLRDLFLGNLPFKIDKVMYDVGILLSQIVSHEFSTSGFFDKDLNVIPNDSSDEYLTFANNCLNNKIVASLLSLKTIEKIKYYLNKHIYLFPKKNEAHLVHGDFDPANIFVNHEDGTWKVSGILDWEFAFSGSALWDISNMLRYAHKMPPQFQEFFLKGFTQNGMTLPENWPITVHLLNLLSLLDLLKRSDPIIAPKRYTDICDLINHILLELDNPNK